MVYPYFLSELAGLNSFFLGALSVSSQYFNIAQINKARKLNQRGKAHRRGCPTAGNSTIQCGVFYSGSKPYINPKTQEKKILRRKLNMTGKQLHKYQKKMRRLGCSVQ